MAAERRHGVASWIFTPAPCKAVRPSGSVAVNVSFNAPRAGSKRGKRCALRNNPDFDSPILRLRIIRNTVARPLLSAITRLAQRLRNLDHTQRIAQNLDLPARPTTLPLPADSVAATSVTRCWSLS